MDIKLIQINSEGFINSAVDLYKKLLNTNEKIATENFFNHAGSFHYELLQISEYEPKSTRVQKLASAYNHIRQVNYWLVLIEKLGVLENNANEIKESATLIENQIKAYFDVERKVLPLKTNS